MSEIKICLVVERQLTIVEGAGARYPLGYGDATRFLLYNKSAEGFMDFLFKYKIATR